SPERSTSVWKRIRTGIAGGSIEACRLLRKRRRVVPHGGYGDRRDPLEYSVGMAPQRSVAHRRRHRNRREGGRQVHRKTLFAVIGGRVRQAAEGQQPGRP